MSRGIEGMRGIQGMGWGLARVKMSEYKKSE